MKQYKELVFKIRDAVREKAKEVPKFMESGNGAIRILAYPMNRQADEWLGGFGDFDSGFMPEGGIGVLQPDIPDIEYTFAITPGGSRVIKGIWDGEEMMVDCYAFSALKIAHCSRAQDEEAGLRSGLELKADHLTEDNGYGPYKGAICFEIFDEKGYFMLLYICVSGADSEDDEKCALAAYDVVVDFFQEYENFSLVTP